MLNAPSTINTRRMSVAGMNTPFQDKDCDPKYPSITTKKEGRHYAD